MKIQVKKDLTEARKISMVPGSVGKAVEKNMPLIKDAKNIDRPLIDQFLDAVRKDVDDKFVKDFDAFEAEARNQNAAKALQYIYNYWLAGLGMRTI